MPFLLIFFHHNFFPKEKDSLCWIHIGIAQHINKNKTPMFWLSVWHFKSEFQGVGPWYYYILETPQLIVLFIQGWEHCLSELHLLPWHTLISLLECLLYILSVPKKSTICLCAMLFWNYFTCKISSPLRTGILCFVFHIDSSIVLVTK